MSIPTDEALLSTMHLAHALFHEAVLLRVASGRQMMNGLQGLLALPLFLVDNIAHFTSIGHRSALNHAHDVALEAKRRAEAAMAEVAARCVTSQGNVSETDRQYSSVWDRNAVGTGHARSMIGSEQAWSAGANDTAQWLMLDLRVPRTICGVAIQKRKQCDQYVTAFRASCGDLPERLVLVDEGQTMSANTVGGPSCEIVKVLFKAPVTARYLRISPLAWHGHVSMRACALLHDSEESLETAQ